MKFTPEVIAALKTLREAAENNFERHRLDVLEQDLTAPPKVEVVDDTHQKFLGFTFSTDYKNHYRLNMNIHRLVWTYFYGEIPSEHAIHHVDFNKANNDIANLQCLTHTEHNRLHMKNHCPHKHAKIKTFTCVFCGKPFTTLHTGSNKYCSVSCRNKAERVNHREDRICVICGAVFNVYKNDKTVTCSRKCGALLASQRRTTHEFKKVCTVCGKEFIANSGRAIYCSNRCRRIRKSS